jgi:hypothetical protein
MTDGLHGRCLSADRLHVTVRWVQLNERWLASADTQHGPSIGCGQTPLAALWRALAPYEEDAEALLASLPKDTLRGKSSAG